MKVVITGFSGFVGTNLSHYLEQANCEIQSLSLRNDNWKETIDLKADPVIHLAGKAHDLKKTSNAEAYFEVNYELTKKVYDCFLKSESEVFVYMSSVKAVKDIVEGVLTEEDVPTPVTAYGQSKLKAEHYILNNIPPNKRVYILRPCMIHGPGNKGNLNLLFQLVSKGFPWPLGSFQNQRSFLSIENLCFVIQELLQQKTIPSGVYNVADDVSLSTNNVIELLGESLGKKSRIWKVPSNWIKTIAKSGDYLHLPLNTERLHKLTENYVVSNHKIVKAIQKPMPVSSREGLMITFASFR
jgi:nucleoside-diphosphate-sugar epimerase